MGSKYVAGLAIFGIIFSTVAMAAEYIVGDADGWDVDPNYSLWASTKVFYVGDTLVFRYEPPHNVYKVDENGFRDCKASGNVLNSGNDTLTLTEPGKKGYICGYSDHCLRGQKLLINVMSIASTPQPPPNHSYKFSIQSGYNSIPAVLLIMAVFAL